MIEKLENKKGFSLVEVLFTLLILSVGVSAVAVLMTGNIKNANTSKDQIIASELAQEGVELVQNLKLNQDLTVPTKTFTQDVLSGDGYRIDYDTNYSTFKNNATPSKLLYLNSAHYLHTASTVPVPTKFYRTISLNIVSGSSATVTSYVTWNGTGFASLTLPGDCNVANKCVSVQAVLPDQY